MKLNIIAFIIALSVIGMAFILENKKTNPIVSVPTQQEDTIPVHNVSIVDGKQIIEIYAKGGYQPRKSIAKAGIPTIVRFNTNGTFDCSSSVRIPSMNINKILPASGITDIDLGKPTATVVYGTCGMGMYPFEIDFQS